MVNYMIDYWRAVGKKEPRHSYLRRQLAQRILRERKERLYQTQPADQIGDYYEKLTKESEKLLEACKAAEEEMRYDHEYNLLDEIHDVLYNEIEAAIALAESRIMKIKYYTIKYNNTNSHRLDEFTTLKAAIDSAKVLHHPDWPIWQGIRVKNAQTHQTVFDSNK